MAAISLLTSPINPAKASAFSMYPTSTESKENVFSETGSSTSFFMSKSSSIDEEQAASKNMVKPRKKITSSHILHVMESIRNIQLKISRFKWTHYLSKFIPNRDYLVVSSDFFGFEIKGTGHK